MFIDMFDIGKRRRHRHHPAGFQAFEPGWRATKMLVSSDLQLIILRLLSEQPRYGYEVIKALEDQSCGIYTPSPGMVYPALTYLGEVGFATASADGSKRLYTLTNEGSAHLSENGEAASEVWQHLARVGRRL